MTRRDMLDDLAGGMLLLIGATVFLAAIDEALPWLAGQALSLWPEATQALAATAQSLLAHGFFFVPLLGMLGAFALTARDSLTPAFALAAASATLLATVRAFAAI